jgi:hypothetical protein
MINKYLYFRTEATDANDDATGDSVCIASSELTVMEPTNDSELTLYFNGRATVKLNLTTANTHLTAMNAISNIINSGQTTATIVIASDQTGKTKYLEGSGIASCGTITAA